MGKIILDGKMYNLESLSIKELNELGEKLKQKENEVREKIENTLNNK